jgi:hypothetical protein
MKPYRLVLAVWMSCGAAAAGWAGCPPIAIGDDCAPALSARLVPGPALDDALHGVSFATASAASFERRVLQGRDDPRHASTPARPELVNAMMGPLPDARPAAVPMPAVHSLDAVRSAEVVAAARGGQVTASAVPEPNSLLMALAGLAAVFVLLSRRARWER